MRYFFSALALIGAVGATPAAAQNNKVVVELFTSQGCSSCPPADALLHDLADRLDVIALALHVDYWDYLGWKDSFAKNSHTQRQHRYAQAANATMVYTPQMVIQGKHHVIGSKGMEVMEHVLAQKAAADPVDITIARNGGNVQINATSKAGRRGKMASSLRSHGRCARPFRSSCSAAALPLHSANRSHRARSWRPPLSWRASWVRSTRLSGDGAIAYRPGLDGWK